MRTRTAQWFEATVRYERQTEDAGQKKVTELYTLDALSFAEAEKRITEELQPFITGDFDVTKLAIAPYGEIFFSDDTADSYWYKARLAFITLDERSAKEKRTTVNFLVQASSLENARKNIVQAMSPTAIDYEIKAITETTIIDVFEHTPPTTKKSE